MIESFDSKPLTKASSHSIEKTKTKSENSEKSEKNDKNDSNGANDTNDTSDKKRMGS